MVVTAEKRTEKLVNVPASISVVPGGRLEQAVATDLVDWSGFVPGLFVTPDGVPGEDILAVDGVAPVGASSEVAIYVGDVPVGSSSSFQQSAGFSMDLLPYDLDRIEVLRGPQGTLYGASTMGGLIKYVLDAPNLEQFSGRVGGDVFGVDHAGSVGGGVRAEVNAPIVEDKLAIRVSAYDENAPGYISDPVDGQKDDNPLSQYGGRVAVLWQAAPDFSAQLEAIYQHANSPNQSVAALSTATNRPIYGYLDDINARPEPYAQEFQLYDLTLNWNLHFAQLTSVTSYQKFTNDAVSDTTAYLGGLLDYYFGALDQSQEDANYSVGKFTQELRLTSPSGNRLEWLIGGYYTHETGSFYQAFDVYGPQGGAVIPALTPLEFVNLPSTYEEYAVFGNATYHFNQWFDLSAGLRYAHNDQTFTETEGGALLGGATNTTPVLTVPGQSSQGVPTFEVSPELHVTPDMMLYARIASGYQPGGPNVLAPGADFPRTFEASTLIDYQIGLKASLPQYRAAFDLSAFYIDWSKIPFLVTVGDQSGFEGAGAARSEGFDFSGTWSPIANLTLGGALTYTDAVVTKPVASIGVFAGDRLPYVPLWSGSLTAEYTFDLVGPWRGFAGGGYRVVGSRYSSIEGAVANGEPQGIELSGYDDLDLHVGARTSGFTLELFAKNALDRRAVLLGTEFYSILVQPIDVRASVLQPTTVGLTVEKSF